MAKGSRGLYVNHSVISRVGGKSLVASAAYRAGLRLHDERQEKTHDYSRKHNVVETAIIGPQSAVEWTEDKNIRRALEKLVNEVERREDQSTKRKTATLAREFICACPREMTNEENWKNGTQFATDVSQRLGVVVILSMHDTAASDGGRNPHLHMLVIPRTHDQKGFGLRCRQFDARGPKADREVLKLRQQFIDCTNKRAEVLGIDMKYTLGENESEPQIHYGHEAWALKQNGVVTEIEKENTARMERNQKADKRKRMDAFAKSISGQRDEELAERQVLRGASKGSKGAKGRMSHVERLQQLRDNGRGFER